MPLQGAEGYTKNLNVTRGLRKNPAQEFFFLKNKSENLYSLNSASHYVTGLYLYIFKYFDELSAKYADQIKGYIYIDNLQP